MELAAKIERFRALKERMPQSELPRWTLAQTYEEAGQKHEAVAEYRALVAMKPDYCMAWLRLGAVLMALGDSAEARLALEKAVALARAQGHEAPRMEAMQLLGALDDSDEDA